MNDNERDNKRLVNDGVAENRSAKGKRFGKKRLLYLFYVIGIAAFLCAIYYLAMEISVRYSAFYYLFPVVLFTYMASLTVLLFVYIIYNRGFSRKGVTPEMLPDDWSEEKKIEFIENGNIRLKRSKWILVFIISIFCTFIVDTFVMYALPALQNLFS